MIIFYLFFNDVERKPALTITYKGGKSFPLCDVRASAIDVSVGYYGQVNDVDDENIFMGAVVQGNGKIL